MQKLSWLLLLLHMLVGIGAVFGGIAAMLNPLRPLNVSVELLDQSPFSNYLIPGLLLFSIIGLGNLLSAVFLYKHTRIAAYTSMVSGGSLIVWIVVQVGMMDLLTFQHIMFFMLGWLEVGMAAAMLFLKKQFPAKQILAYYRNKRKKSS